MDPQEQIKAKIDIVPFIQEYVTLKKAGRNYKAPCPFHADKTPSFVVSPERGIWHCFGCGKGGDVFTFLMEFDHIDFTEALRFLAEKTGVQLTQFVAPAESAYKERLVSISHLAGEYFHFLLTKHSVGKNALDYLHKRGITDRAIETFKLGYAPPQWDSLLLYLVKKKGFASKEVVDAGLAVEGKRIYDRFRGRVMFTLRNHRGSIVGFAGRVLPTASDEEQKEAKYINTPETILYHKGELVYGLEVTKEAIRKENAVIVAEGEFDVIQSFQAGIANIVAIKGTALTEMQVKLLKRFAETLIIALDMDFAGDQAAHRSIDIAEKEGFTIKVVQLTDAKDPDEAILKNPLLWKKAVEKAIPVYDFLINSATSRFSKTTADGKKKIAAEVLPALSRIQNEIVKAHYIKRLSSELDTQEDVIERQMQQVAKMQKIAPVIAQQAPAIPKVRQELLEEVFLAMVLQQEQTSLLKEELMNMDDSYFETIPYQKIFRSLVAFLSLDKPFSIEAFIPFVPKELVGHIDRLYLLDSNKFHEKDKPLELPAIVRQLRILSLRKKLNEVTHKLKEGKDENLPQLNKEFQDLSLTLRELLKKVEASK